MSNKKGIYLFLVFLFSLTLTIAGCGGSSGDDDDDADIGAAISFPSGMVIASLTASSSSDDATLVAGHDGVSFATIDADDTYSAKASAFETVLAAASDETCQITLPTMENAVDPNCYGPNLDYCNHTDFTAAAQDAGCVDADAGGVDNVNDTDGDGQLPSGDLGIWTSTEGDNNEACAAAKINSLIESTASRSDSVMLMAASMICLMKRAGTDLPSSDGSSEDLTTELNTAIQINNANVTVTEATIENLADVTDADGTSREVYQFTIISEISEDVTVTATGYMKHMPTATDNSTYMGRLWSETEGLIGAGDKDAFSITYEKASSTSLNYRVLSANYQGAGASTTIFDSNGDLDVGGDWTGNFAMAIINVDPSTGIGNFSYGWSAGTGGGGNAEEARIFNGYTTATGGCGFFGYGAGFDNSGDGTLSDNVIDGFICNWAGPNNSHDMTGDTANRAQKQCMTLDSTTGVFGVDATKENITYAPEVDCNGSGTFMVRVPDAAHAAAPAANDLVDLTTDTDFDSYTAPSAPSLPTGL